MWVWPGDMLCPVSEAWKASVNLAGRWEPSGYQVTEPEMACRRGRKEECPGQQLPTAWYVSEAGLDFQPLTELPAARRHL